MLLVPARSDFGRRIDFFVICYLKKTRKKTRKKIIKKIYKFNFNIGVVNPLHTKKYIQT